MNMRGHALAFVEAQTSGGESYVNLLFFSDSLCPGRSFCDTVWEQEPGAVIFLRAELMGTWPRVLASLFRQLDQALP